MVLFAVINTFTLIFFVSTIGLIIGIFKPKVVVRWKEEASRKDVFKIYLSLIFISLIGVGIFAPEVENKKSETKQVSSNDKIEQPQNVEVDEDYEKSKLRQKVVIEQSRLNK